MTSTLRSPRSDIRRPLEFHGDSRALVRLARDEKLAAPGLRYALHDGQSEARSALPRGMEGLQGALSLFRGHAVSVVGNDEPDLVALFSDLDSHRAPAFGQGRQGIEP